MNSFNQCYGLWYLTAEQQIEYKSEQKIYISFQIVNCDLL